MGGFSVPAYAGGGEEPADGTNDSNVQVEQPEETPPLTPDGNPAAGQQRVQFLRGHADRPHQLDDLQVLRLGFLWNGAPAS